MSENARANKKRYIYIIHGIRTRATWLPQLQNELRDQIHGKVEAGGYYYGGFSLPMFLVRARFTSEHIARISEKLDALTRENYEITCIPHSFGTYLLYEALKQNPKIKINNVILCGSILGHYAPIDAMKGIQISGSVFNFCGRRDPVPPLAELLSRSFSATGTEGLFNFITRNSFHDVGHGDFLTPSFWRNHW